MRMLSAFAAKRNACASSNAICLCAPSVPSKRFFRYSRMASSGMPVADKQEIVTND